MEKPELKDSDKMRLENQNLKISNLNLQLQAISAQMAFLNEKARSLQLEIVSLRTEREGLVKEIEQNTLPVNGEGRVGSQPPQSSASGGSTGGELSAWRLNPDTMEFEKGSKE